MSCRTANHQSTVGPYHCCISWSILEHFTNFLLLKVEHFAPRRQHVTAARSIQTPQRIGSSRPPNGAPKWEAFERCNVGKLRVSDLEDLMKKLMTYDIPVPSLFLFHPFSILFPFFSLGDLRVLQSLGLFFASFLLLKFSELMTRGANPLGTTLAALQCD